MRWFLIVVFAVLFAVAGVSTAVANPRADALHRQGNVLAQAKHYAAAIAKYKAGQKLQPTWQRLCNIGRSYRYLNKLPQAALFLHRCQAASALMLAPAMQAQLARVVARLRAGRFAQVTLTVTPADAAINAPLYEPDELIVSGERFWLPLGSRSVEVTRAGMNSHTVSLALTDTSAVTRSITLHRRSAAAAPVVGATTPPRTLSSSRSRAAASSSPSTQPAQPPVSLRRDGHGARRRAGLVPRVMVAGGIASLAAGAMFHVFALRTFDRADALDPVPRGEPSPVFDSELDTFKTQRLAAVGFYALGAVATGAGVYLWLRSAKGAKSTGTRSTQIGAAAARSGVSVFARWSL